MLFRVGGLHLLPLRRKQLLFFCFMELFGAIILRISWLSCCFIKLCKSVWLFRHLWNLLWIIGIVDYELSTRCGNDLCCTTALCCFLHFDDLMHSYGLLVVLKTLQIIVFVDAFIHLFWFIKGFIDIARGEDRVATCCVFPKIDVFFESAVPIKSICPVFGENL